MPTLTTHRPILIIIAAGAAIRLVLAFALFGHGDILAFQVAYQYLDANGLDFYAVNLEQPFGGGYVWPYPPAALAWVFAAGRFAAASGLAFDAVVQLLPILADVGIAIAIYVWLGWRGASERLRLAGLALVMLGTSFIAISGYHGQIDSAAILFGVLGVMAWERAGPANRALIAGALIGVGATIKWIPLLLVLALLPSVRSWTEAAKLMIAAAIIPLVVLAPFFAAQPEAVSLLPSYSAFPGLGLVLQPELAQSWATIDFIGLSNLSDPVIFLNDNAGRITIAVLLVLGAFMLRYRPAPIDAAVLVWLAIYAFSPNFFLQYMVWGLPFFIMAGYLWQTAVLQAVLLAPTVIFYLAPWPNGDVGIPYAVIMIGLWAFWVGALAVLLARVVRRRDSHPKGVQPPLVNLALGPGRA